MAKYRPVAGESAEVAAERNDVVGSSPGLSNMKTVSIERVNFGDRAVEIPTVQIDHAALGRPVDKRFEHNLAMVQGRLRDVGVHKATLISFLPFALRSPSMIEQLRKALVPAPKDKEECAVFVFSTVAIEPARLGADSPLIAVDHHPITLAKEFERVYETFGNCVFAFVGLPEDIGKPGWAHQERYDTCKDSAVAWMQDQLKIGNGFWNTKDHLDAFRITDYMRNSARRLYHLGFIKELPEWVDRQRDLAVKVPTCQKCQRPSEPNSAVCTNGNCNYIIDPRRAFEIGDIDENHAALERLTREEVTDMGISAYVAETADERPERMRNGLPKPLSLVAERLLQQQMQAEEEQRQIDRSQLVAHLSANNAAKQAQTQPAK